MEFREFMLSKNVKNVQTSAQCTRICLHWKNLCVLDIAPCLKITGFSLILPLIYIIMEQQKHLEESGKKNRGMLTFVLSYWVEKGACVCVSWSHFQFSKRFTAGILDMNAPIHTPFIWLWLLKWILVASVARFLFYCQEIPRVESRPMLKTRLMSVHVCCTPQKKVTITTLKMINSTLKYLIIVHRLKLYSFYQSCMVWYIIVV